MSRGSPRDFRHEMMMRGKTAGRVCSFKIAGQREGLTAAAAKINLFSRTGTARLLHPLQAAKAIEGCPLIPYQSKRLVFDSVE